MLLALCVQLLSDSSTFFIVFINFFYTFINMAR